MRVVRTTFIAATAFLCVAVFVMATLVAPPLDPLLVDPFWLVWVGFPVVGAIILIKSRGNRIGLIQLIIGVCAALSGLTSVLSDFGSDPRALALVNQVAFMPIFVLVPLLILLFPSGRPPSPGWRIPIIGDIVVGILLIAWFAIRPVEYSLDAVDFYANPLGIPALAPFDDLVLTVLSVSLFVFAAAALVQAVVSYRRADLIGRLQVKWVIAPAIAAPLVFLLGALPENLGGDVALSNLLVIAAFLIGANGIAAGIGVAVLRHRLYGIDQIVSRTVTYGLVVLGLAIFYFAVVTAMTSLVGSQEPLVVAVATLAVAALFNPLRRSARKWVDRRFNRSRYDTERLMDSFADSLRDRVNPEEVLGDWVEVVDQTMQPSGLGVWIKVNP